MTPDDLTRTRTALSLQLLRLPAMVEALPPEHRHGEALALARMFADASAQWQVLAEKHRDPRPAPLWPQPAAGLVPVPKPEPDPPRRRRWRDALVMAVLVGLGMRRVAVPPPVVVPSRVAPGRRAVLA